MAATRDTTPGTAPAVNDQSRRQLVGGELRAALAGRAGVEGPTLPEHQEALPTPEASDAELIDL